MGLTSLFLFVNFLFATKPVYFFVNFSQLLRFTFNDFFIYKIYFTLLKFWNYCYYLLISFFSCHTSPTQHCIYVWSCVEEKMEFQKIVIGIWLSACDVVQGIYEWEKFKIYYTWKLLFCMTTINVLLKILHAINPKKIPKSVCKFIAFRIIYFLVFLDNQQY